MVHLHERFKAFLKSRWLVFVCAIWIQSFTGIGYLFGSISPMIKSIMGYNQRQLSLLGVVKTLGGSVGFVAGSLSEVLPIWGLLLIGALQNFVGYGLLWYIVHRRWSGVPLWVLCICIFVGGNGETFFNTANLVCCVQNFPKNRGPVVGILKGFCGLTGATLIQVYAIFNFPDKASLIFMVAVGPTMVVIAFMFVVRPVEGHKQVRESDDSSFLFTYSICLVLAAYLLGVLILEDTLNLNQSIITLLAIGLIILIVLPIIIPVVLVFFSTPQPSSEEKLLANPLLPRQDTSELILSEAEEERTSELDALPAFERRKRLAHLQAKLLQAAADGAVRVKRDFAYPRPLAMAMLQVIMAFGFFYYAMGWPGQIYVVTVLIGLGYGSHWAILPAAVSELFGLKSFGALYNFLTLSNPAGSLIFSEALASGLYDYYAEKQASLLLQNPISTLGQDKSLTCLGTICYSLTCGILSGLCIVAAMLSLVVVYRTRRVYTQLYGSSNSLI
ncbi:hypothetical protein F8388_007615 [Cannabis sativa]|uniref:Nodulin-like domain-containing protein n=1 Tax=Cannabis sativa TaxID=3483 RepID=A0A7J6EV78_CANSA|nr:hypothetical protein F8388_007615 [Cannabis sativa]